MKGNPCLIGFNAFLRPIKSCHSTALGSLLAVMAMSVSADPFSGTMVYLDKLNWNGSVHHSPGAPAKVGGWARGPTIAYSHEAIVKFDLSAVSGTLQFAKVRVHVTGGVTGVYSNVTAFDANQGAWSPSTVTYDTFCNGQTGCVSWTSALGNVDMNAAQPGWYEIEGTVLLAKVQQWVNTPSSNNGLILSGNFYTHEYYVDVDQVELVVNTELPSANPYAEWPRHGPVALNTSPTGANVTTTVQNFPLLLRLDAQNFNFDEAKVDGSDLRLSRILPDGSEVKLPVQIERWDKAAKKAEVWVMVDEILGNDNHQSLTMHWGHSSPPPDALPPVFSSSNGFVALYHLNESPGGAAGGYKDATSNGYHATGLGGVGATTGQVGQGQGFDGVNDYLTLPTLPNSPQTTVSAWYRMTAPLKANAAVVSNKYWSDGVVHFKNNNGTLIAAPKSGTNAQVTGQAVATWYHATYTYTRAGALNLYVNGVLAATSTAPNFDWLGTNLEIGHENSNYSSGGSFFSGALDEARIENLARSAEWIKLSYENQRTDQRLVRTVSQHFPRAGGRVYGSINMNGYTVDNVSMVETKKISVPTPDYVFDPEYRLPSLASTEQHIQDHRHLPGIPSANEMERSGMDVGAMNLMILKQVEHLHLYLLDHDKRLRKLEERKSSKP